MISCLRQLIRLSMSCLINHITSGGLYPVPITMIQSVRPGMVQSVIIQLANLVRSVMVMLVRSDQSRLRWSGRSWSC
ncbi:uncharacterized protein BDW43DRAFT_295472 [Aspergillus alliaceus]|uniref:uncharacterized protein n=1 Tax=Petromyces alliaceus TaxID=209559 RepID=UPI0012A3F3A3|nr:uncharacterized protein BDW43DRAFT_295472 [Aspergillus alliaceus]KAB8226892.1 hypothetical protein BDW43DRAFT_295472 [Aspergillus alliaceus]